MSKMNFEKWPVVDMHDFCEVIVDVTRHEIDADDVDDAVDEPEVFYSVILNYVHEYGEGPEGAAGNSGFTQCTGIVGTNLREIYTKITAMIELGYFDGSNVQSHGTLWSDEHDKIAEICWHQYSDEEFDNDCGLTYVDSDVNDGDEVSGFNAAAISTPTPTIH